MTDLTRGFTLIELLVVMVVLVVVAVVGIPAYVGYRDSAIGAKCVMRLRCIQTAREAYFFANTGATDGADWDRICFFVGLHDVKFQQSANVQNATANHQCPYNGLEYSWSGNRSDLSLLPVCPNYDAVTLPLHTLGRDVQ